MGGSTGLWAGAGAAVCGRGAGGWVAGWLAATDDVAGCRAGWKERTSAGEEAQSTGGGGGEGAQWPRGGKLHTISTENISGDFENM